MTFELLWLQLSFVPLLGLYRGICYDKSKDRHVSSYNPAYLYPCKRNRGGEGVKSRLISVLSKRIDYIR